MDAVDREWLEQIPELHGAEWETAQTVPGDRVNPLWRIESKAGPVAVRRNATSVDRDLECRVARRVAEAGLGPPVVACGDDYLITGWVEGKPWTAADLNDPSRCRLLMRSLRELHALPADDLPATRWAEELPRLLKASTLAENSALKSRTRDLAQRLIDSGLDGDARALCHHDLHLGQVVGDFPQLLDFEYARRADPAIDLAWLIQYHDLPMDQQRMLVADYYGREDRAVLGTVALAMELTQLLELLWLAEHSNHLGAEQHQRLRRLKLVLA
ncbi:MAG: phosphotransferase [Pseudomonadota bacterium]